MVPFVRVEIVQVLGQTVLGLYQDLKYFGCQLNRLELVHLLFSDQMLVVADQKVAQRNQYLVVKLVQIWQKY